MNINSALLYSTLIGERKSAKAKSKNIASKEKNKKQCIDIKSTKVNTGLQTKKINSYKKQNKAPNNFNKIIIKIIINK